MNQILRFILFIGIISTLYFGLQYYVFYRTSILFGFKRGFFFHLIVAVAALSYPMGLLLLRLAPNQITRAVLMASDDDRIRDIKVSGALGEARRAAAE